MKVTAAKNDVSTSLPQVVGNNWESFSLELISGSLFLCFRGVFLSCVMYSEDKLLVTTEEFLPTIEIDETFPSTLHTDFHWLLKVCCPGLVIIRNLCDALVLASMFITKPSIDYSIRQKCRENENIDVGISSYEF